MKKHLNDTLPVDLLAAETIVTIRNFEDLIVRRSEYSPKAAPNDTAEVTVNADVDISLVLILRNATFSLCGTDVVCEEYRNHIESTSRQVVCHCAANTSVMSTNFRKAMYIFPKNLLLVADYDQTVRGGSEV
uniref:Uncharacterized protein n=1 Tax=Glossina morsitans morsitans TaxID=37546 RepID=A0A1B0GCL3_GLOMM